MGGGLTVQAPYETLKVWERAHQLVLAVYNATEKFPKSEQFGLASQLRRAAVGIPANLAEGNARHSIRDYLRFCYIARGSLAELRYLLRLAADLYYLSAETFQACMVKCDEVGKMLHFLIEGLRKRDRGANPPERDATAGLPLPRSLVP